jgi:F-type H+-transporting ATPase subunit a
MLYSPLEQFSIVSLLSYNLPGTNLSFFVFSNFILMLFFTALIFSVVFLISVKKHNKVFTPFLIVFNNYYSFVITIIRENFIKKGFFFFPYLFLLMSFLLVANLLGMIPYSFALTSHFAITLFLSFLTFFAGSL